MKKKILFPLLILITTFFGFISCKQQVQSKTQVSLSFPVQELYNQMSCRAANNSFSESESLSFEIKLFVNNREFAKQSAAFDPKKESQTIEFNQVPVYSTVYAEAWVKASLTKNGKQTTIDRLYGKSKSVRVTEAGAELPLALKWVESQVESKVENVFINLYIQEKDSSGKAIDSYKLYKTLSLYSDLTSAQSSNSFYDDPSFVAEYTWASVELREKGYDYRSNLDEEYEDEEGQISFENGKININYYFNVDPKPEPVEILEGSAGGKSYSIHIIDGSYIIYDNNNQAIGLGMFNFDPDSGKTSFIQILYKDNEKAYFPSYFYENGNFLGTQNIPMLDYWSTAIISHSTSSFALKYYSSADPILITFNIPEVFDLYDFLLAFDGRGQGSEESLSAYIIVDGTPQVLIEKSDLSSDLYLNEGQLLFDLTKLDENVTLTNISAKLYYAGNEVPSSQYTVQTTEANVLKISPKNLSKGGNYIVKVIVKGKIKDSVFEASSDYSVKVTEMFVATLDVSKDTFLTDLIDILSAATGPVSLALTGERNVSVADSYSSEYSLYYDIGCILQQYKQNPIELDFSAVTGSAVNVFESKLLTGVCTSVKLSPSLKAIKYYPESPVTITTDDTALLNDTWYLIQMDNSWSDSDEAKLVYQVLAGKKELSQIRDDIPDEFNIFTLYWDDVLEIVCNDYQTSYNYTYYLIRGEN